MKKKWTILILVPKIFSAIARKDENFRKIGHQENQNAADLTILLDEEKMIHFNIAICLMTMISNNAL